MLWASVLGLHSHGFYSAGDKPAPRGLEFKQQVHLCIAVTTELFRVAWAMCDVPCVSLSSECTRSLVMPAHPTLTGTEENGAKWVLLLAGVLARHLVSFCSGLSTALCSTALIHMEGRHLQGTCRCIVLACSQRHHFCRACACVCVRLCLWVTCRGWGDCPFALCHGQRPHVSLGWV